MVYNPKRIIDGGGRPIYGFYIGNLNCMNGKNSNSSGKFNYEIFDRLIRKNPEVLDGNIEGIVGRRREILMKSGYNFLRSGKNRWIPIESAEYDRVNNVFKERYKSLQDRQERYYDLASSLVVDSMIEE